MLCCIMTVLGLLLPLATEKKSPPAPRVQILTGHVSIEKESQVFDKIEFISVEHKKFELIGLYVAELYRLTQATLEVEVESIGEGSLLPRYRLSRYRILNLGQGENPDIGKIEKVGDRIQLLTNDNKILILQDSELTERLKDYIGCRIWFIGKATKKNMFKLLRIGFLTDSLNSRSMVEVK